MKKNNNKGFMLLETMIVSAFIITTLTFLYVQFSNLKKSYEESFKYDSIPELYKAKEKNTIHIIPIISTLNSDDVYITLPLFFYISVQIT